MAPALLDLRSAASKERELDVSFKSTKFSVIRLTYLEEYMWETCAEIRPIYIELLLAGQVHIDAARAVDFDTRR